MGTTIKDRIMEYAKEKHITIREFERKSGLSNGYINSIRKGLGVEKLENVLKSFPDLNRDWLLYGEGTMLIDSSTSNGSHSSQAVGEGATANNSEGVKECLEIIRKQQESIDKLVDAIAALSHSSTRT